MEILSKMAEQPDEKVELDVPTYMTNLLSSRVFNMWQIWKARNDIRLNWKQGQSWNNGR